MRDIYHLIILMVLASSIGQAGCSGTPRDFSVGSADRMNTFELMTAAAAAHSAGRTEDAGFLFLAGQMRFQIDKQVYPPAGKGGDSPDTLKAALRASIGQSIGPALANDPVAQANIAKRLAQWTPGFGEGYDPGWKYQNALDGKAATVIVATTRKQVLLPLQSKAKLTENQEYVRHSKDLADAEMAVEKIHNLRKQSGAKTLPENLKQELQAAITKRDAAQKHLMGLQWKLIPESRFHERVGWHAEDYFHDPQVIALCRAIAANDLEEMERLIADGADVKAIGKDGMTPLLWAFPDRQLERFECLLQHGADPNVFFAGDFGIGNRPFHPYPNGGALLEDRGCHAGQSVMHLASRSPVIAYLESVVAHRGNVNLVDQKTGETPLNIVLSREIFDSKERVGLLLANKANPNHYSPYRLAYPAMQAVQNGDYDVALQLLEAGADPQLYQPEGERKLVHIVLRERRQLANLSELKAGQFQALVNWLEGHGESLERAEQDETQWAMLYKKAFTPAMHAKVRKQIITERNARQSDEAAQDTR